MTRSEIIDKAIIDCLDEMYRKSQPSITWEEVTAQAKENPNRHIWQEHYLPQHLYLNIQEKYMRMYRLQEEWSSNIEVLENYLKEGGTKDKYIEACTDENGNYHPGYRGYENVPPIARQIQTILEEQLEQGTRAESLKNLIVDAVMNTINDCKEFYKFDREELSFRMNVSNYSPNSNIEAVREFYKDTDIVINEIEEKDEEEDE